MVLAILVVVVVVAVIGVVVIATVVKITIVVVVALAVVIAAVVRRWSAAGCYGIPVPIVVIAEMLGVLAHPLDEAWHNARPR